jgi:hypothetical protein
VALPPVNRLVQASSIAECHTARRVRITRLPIVPVPDPDEELKANKIAGQTAG